MIPATRFIARSSDRAGWLAARAQGVTATTIAKAMTPQGFRDVVAERLNPTVIEDNLYMAFGRDNEGWLAMAVKADTGIMPNDWLIASEANPLFLATPDGLSLDHTEIAEIKTGGKEALKPSRIHRDQILWQLFVTGAVCCRYAFMLRKDMQPAWIEPACMWIDRDEARIAELIHTAELLLIDYENWII